MKDLLPELRFQILSHLTDDNYKSLRAWACTHQTALEGGHSSYFIDMLATIESHACPLPILKFAISMSLRHALKRARKDRRKLFALFKDNQY